MRAEGIYIKLDHETTTNIKYALSLCENKKEVCDLIRHLVLDMEKKLMPLQFARMLELEKEGK